MEQYLYWDPTTQPLGVADGFIFLEAELNNDTIEDDKTVLIALTEEQYFAGLKAWLTEKRDYCERYGHFCGQNGSICSTEYTQINIGCSATYDKAYLIHSHDAPDMEHG